MTLYPKRRTREKMGVRQPTVLRSPAHLAWCRTRRCIAEGQECLGRIEAHHVRENGNGGMGMKPGDDDAVPLCSYHHAELHRIGALTFQSRHGCDLDKQAAAHWQASPHRHKAQQKMESRT